MGLELHKKFLKESAEKAFNTGHRKTIKYNMARYDIAVEKGKKQFSDIELAKSRASNLKKKVINDLESYLKVFESNFIKRGGRVIWAENSHKAVEEIRNIMKENDIKMIVKSKSMTTEEIEFNQSMEKQKIETVETDLGEYIVQLAGEKPYHIVTPAMHKSKEDIAQLFHEKFNLKEDATPEEITVFVRKLLREKFVSADIGVTGGNFLIADTGAVCLTENEGNGLMSISFPKIHIAIVGIEKIIPSLEDLHLFWPLLASMGTGQNITVYNSIISGPRKEDETDGPEKMYVILLDNKRTIALSQEQQKLSLACIRCGACLNACPVYRNIGGYTYNTTYSGPIGSVLTPFLGGFSDFKHLSFASSLCGGCTEVCPVKIPLHELLLYNRHNSVKEGHVTASEKISMTGWKKIMRKRKNMNMVNAGLKNFFIKRFIGKTWGSRRQIPRIAKHSFNELWKEKKS